MAKKIGNLIRNILPVKNNWKLQLLQNWDSIFGNLSTKVHLEKVTDDTIVLGVIDACWMQELYMLSHILLKTINEKLDQPRIKKLRFKRVGNPKQYKHLKAPPRKKEAKPVVLSSAEEQALNTIEDPELRTVLKKFLIRCYQE